MKTLKLLLVFAFSVSTAWGSGKAAVSPKSSLSVDQIAANPAGHLGNVSVVGRVAAVTPGKGFTLVDSGKCSSCTTECSTDKNAPKLPLRWTGAAPKVKDVVRVQARLSKSPKGYLLLADKVAKQ